MSEMLNRYNYNFPTSIRFGKGVIDELGPHLKEMGFKKPLIVSDAGFTQTDVFKKVIEMVKASGITPVVFSEINKNPVKSNVMKGVAFYKSESADCIVGFGGGASMDVARAIALGINHHRDLFDYDDAVGGDNYVTEEVPYFVTIPTTAGTGSEVGRSTVIADDVSCEKKILFSPKLLAKKVFADPELTMGLPEFVTATTGMDALTHNVEAFLSKGFSPLCDGIALEAVRLISISLEKAVTAPDFDSRARMMMASLMGATAFQKGLGVVHSLAHPLSTVMDMHHGLANAIMIPYGMEFNLDQCEEKLTRLAITVNAKNKTARGFIEWLKELNQKIGIPEKLTGQKVTRDHLARLSDLAIKDPCHSSNPKTVTKSDMTSLYEKAL